MPVAGALTTEEVASLYRRHVKTVYQISRMLLKNGPDAEDAVQNVFRKAMERDEPFDGPDHERAWLIVTARNECKNQLRHWWRTRRADAETLDALAWEQPADGELWDMILRLPEHEKTALYLHYYQGYSTNETAELMGKNPSTVRSWLFRARRRLKDLLEEDGEYGG
ncbi:MAG: sigma-70 family RNA polymerase sigma factor [Oscillospiraceae bacterium]|nr:sigma-70 family RNA polymerase sigma factor [Oscillospiraceae bacterium]